MYRNVIQIFIPDFIFNFTLIKVKIVKGVLVLMRIKIGIDLTYLKRLAGEFLLIVSSFEDGINLI